MAGTRTRHDAGEAGGIGHGYAADVEITDQASKPCQTRIAIETKARCQDLEGHARANVAELGAIEIEPHRALGAVCRFLQPTELRAWNDETADQPRRSDAVDPQMSAGGPHMASIVLHATMRNRRFLYPWFVGRELRVERVFGVGQCSLHLRTCHARKEVDCGHRFQLAPGGGESFARFGFGEFPQFAAQYRQAFEGLRISLGTIEGSAQFSFLFGI